MFRCPLSFNFRFLNCICKLILACLLKLGFRMFLSFYVQMFFKLCYSYSVKNLFLKCHLNLDAETPFTFRFGKFLHTTIFKYSSKSSFKISCIFRFEISFTFRCSTPIQHVNSNLPIKLDFKSPPLSW